MGTIMYPALQDGSSVGADEERDKRVKVELDPEDFV